MRQKANQHATFYADLQPARLVAIARSLILGLAFNRNIDGRQSIKLRRIDLDDAKYVNIREAVNFKQISKNRL